MDYEPVLYRGIDFVLKTRKPVRALVAELKHIHYNRVWKRTRTIVLSSPSSKSGIESEINAFCVQIERLSATALLEWKACSSRLIDIGIDSGNVIYGEKIVPLDLQISVATLKRISDIRGKLVITVYPYVVGAGSIPAVSSKA